MDPAKLKGVLPEPPAGMSVVEWLAVATMTAMLLGYLVNEFIVRPRQAAALERARQEAMREERKEREDAAMRFLEALVRQRSEFSSTMRDLARSNERAVDRIHSRIGEVVRANVATRAAISRLECYRHDEDDGDDPARNGGPTPPYQGPERRRTARGPD